MPQTTQRREDNYYSVLGFVLLNNGEPPAVSKDDLRAAYHRSLLLYHPDKVVSSNITIDTSKDGPTSATTKHTVDEIMKAYDTLSDPALKTAYDESLRMSWYHNVSGRNHVSNSTSLGLETYDLEDLLYHENDQTWTKPCRCGNTEGYLVSESDLEDASSDGEIIVECRGCSLHVKVTFETADEGGS